MKRLVSVITLILLIAVLAVGLGVLTNGFKSWNPKDWLNWNASKETARILDGDGAELTDGATLPAQMVYAAGAASAPKKITLTATVTPAEATYQGLNWAVEWVNSSSAFAVGKSVEDFVTIAQKTDKSAELSFLAAFGSQIKLTVSAIDNPRASAQCLIDCVKPIQSVVVTIQPCSQVAGKPTISRPSSARIVIDSAELENSSRPYTIVSFDPSSGGLIDEGIEIYTTEISYDIRYGVGTIEDSYEAFGDIFVADEIVSAFAAAGVEIKRDPQDLASLNFFLDAYSVQELFNPSGKNVLAIRSVLAKNPVSQLTLNFLLQGKYSEFGREFDFIFDSESIKVPVNAIELNQGTHVFTD